MGDNGNKMEFSDADTSKDKQWNMFNPLSESEFSRVSEKLFINIDRLSVASSVDDGEDEDVDAYCRNSRFEANYVDSLEKESRKEEDIARRKDGALFLDGEVFRNVQDLPDSKSVYDVDVMTTNNIRKHGGTTSPSRSTHLSETDSLEEYEDTGRTVSKTADDEFFLMSEHFRVGHSANRVDKFPTPLTDSVQSSYRDYSRLFFDDCQSENGILFESTAEANDFDYMTNASGVKHPWIKPSQRLLKVSVSDGHLKGHTYATCKNGGPISELTPSWSVSERGFYMDPRQSGLVNKIEFDADKQSSNLMGDVQSCDILDMLVNNTNGTKTEIIHDVESDIIQYDSIPTAAENTCNSLETDRMGTNSPSCFQGHVEEDFTAVPHELYEEGSRSLELYMEVSADELSLRKEIIRDSGLLKKVLHCDYNQEIPLATKSPEIILITDDERLGLSDCLPSILNASSPVKQLGGLNLMNGECFDRESVKWLKPRLTEHFDDDTCRMSIENVADDFGETKQFASGKAVAIQEHNDLFETGVGIHNGSEIVNFDAMSDFHERFEFSSTSSSPSDETLAGELPARSIMNEFFPDLFVGSSSFSESALACEEDLYFRLENDSLSNLTIRSCRMPSVETDDMLSCYSSFGEDTEVRKHCWSVVEDAGSAMELSFNEQFALMEEDANLICSEIELQLSMAVSTCSSNADDVRLLECETISLVSSTDNNPSDDDDDHSESRSVLLSSEDLLPLTANDGESVPACNAADTVPRFIGRPRILKPGEVKVERDEPQIQEATPRAIKGRRRALYPGNSSNKTVPVIMPGRGIGQTPLLTPKNMQFGGQQKSLNQPGTNIKMKALSQKPLVPKKATSGTAISNTEGAKSVTRPAKVTITKAGNTSALISTNGPLPSKSVQPLLKVVTSSQKIIPPSPKVTLKSDIPKTELRKKLIVTKPSNRVSKAECEDDERPKPLIKQDTFIKEASNTSNTVEETSRVGSSRIQGDKTSNNKSQILAPTGSGNKFLRRCSPDKKITNTLAAPDKAATSVVAVNSEGMHSVTSSADNKHKILASSSSNPLGQFRRSNRSSVSGSTGGMSPSASVNSRIGSSSPASNGRTRGNSPAVSVNSPAMLRKNNQGNSGIAFGRNVTQFQSSIAGRAGSGSRLHDSNIGGNGAIPKTKSFPPQRRPMSWGKTVNVLAKEATGCATSSRSMEVVTASRGNSVTASRSSGVVNSGVTSLAVQRKGASAVNDTAANEKTKSGRPVAAPESMRVGVNQSSSKRDNRKSIESNVSAEHSNVFPPGVAGFPLTRSSTYDKLTDDAIDKITDSSSMEVSHPSDERSSSVEHNFQAKHSRYSYEQSIDQNRRSQTPVFKFCTDDEDQDKISLNRQCPMKRNSRISISSQDSYKDPGATGNLPDADINMKGADVQGVQYRAPGEVARGKPRPSLAIDCGLSQRSRNMHYQLSRKYGDQRPSSCVLEELGVAVAMETESEEYLPQSLQAKHDHLIGSCRLGQMPVNPPTTTIRTKYDYSSAKDCPNKIVENNETMTTQKSGKVYATEPKKSRFGLLRRYYKSALEKPKLTNGNEGTDMTTKENKPLSPKRKVMNWFRRNNTDGGKLSGTSSTFPRTNSNLPTSKRDLPSRNGGESSLVRSAIVQPFNYRPVRIGSNADIVVPTRQITSDSAVSKGTTTTFRTEAVAVPERKTNPRHLTKTDMLISRLKRSNTSATSNPETGLPSRISSFPAHRLSGAVHQKETLNAVNSQKGEKAETPAAFLVTAV